MIDLLRAARSVPEFGAAVRVHMVEVSRTLKKEQERALHAKGHLAKWHHGIEDVAQGPAIIIANEFLDAFPVRQYVFDGAWRQRVIDASDGALKFGTGAAVKDFAHDAAQEGAIAELRPGEEQLLSELQRREGSLAALVIDYGPAEHALGETLQAVRDHAYADPLSAPGEADLTAHVQFAALAEKCRAAGFQVQGPVTQAEFLGRLGLAERAARLMSTNPARAGDIETAAQRLVSPTGMGSLFKVLALRSPSLSPLPGFG
jgi:NADH dehydrogenase [ubiquinone] 1 alpha subcomplex assembly factor 7